MEIIPHNLEANHKKITNAFVRAAKQKCDFLCLPEECWAGLEYEEKYQNEVAEFMKSKISALSKKHGLYCIAGSVVEKLEETRDHEIHNLTYLFDRDGNILGHYAKRHFSRFETGRLPGKSHSVIETEFGKIGLELCRDILYPEATQVTADLGAKIVFIPALWSKFSSVFSHSLALHHIDEMQIIKYLVPARALENEVIMVFCDAAGRHKIPKRTDVLLGYTQVTEPFVGPTQILRHNREELLIHTVDTDIVDKMRAGWRIRGH